MIDTTSKLLLKLPTKRKSLVTKLSSVENLEKEEAKIDGLNFQIKQPSCIA